MENQPLTTAIKNGWKNYEFKLFLEKLSFEEDKEQLYAGIITAVKLYQYEVISMLVEQFPGIVNLDGQNGCTALVKACRIFNKKGADKTAITRIIKFLVNHGSNVLAMVDNDKSVLVFAKEHCDEELFLIIEEKAKKRINCICHMAA